MLFACCCTAPPTTWSTSFVIICRSPGAQPRSKLARPVVQTRRSHTPDRPLRSLSPRHRLALSEPVPFRRARRQQQLTRFLTSEPDSPQAVSAEPCAKSPALCSRSSFVSHPPLRPLDSAIPRHPDHTFRSSDELSRLVSNPFGSERRNMSSLPPPWQLHS